MSTARENEEQRARDHFEVMRNTVASGEGAYVAMRLTEYDAQEATWDRFNAADSARREHDLRGAA